MDKKKTKTKVEKELHKEVMELLRKHFIALDNFRKQPVSEYYYK